MSNKETISQETNPVTYYFLNSVFLSTVMIFPFIMDLTLVPRYITLAFFLSLSLFHVYKKKQITQVSLDSVLLFYVAYTLFCCLSVFWSSTKSEAIFESSKQVLSLFVFLFTYYILKSGNSDFMKRLAGFSLFFLLMELLAVIHQLRGIEKLNKDTIYLLSGLNGHKNLLSSFLFLNFFPLFIAFRKYEKQWKFLAGFALLLNLGLIVFLRTKAVWFGLSLTFLIALVFYVLHSDKKEQKEKINPKIAVIFVCLLLNIFFFNLLQPIIQKGIHYTTQSESVTSTENPVKLEEERLILWDKTYNMLHQHNLFGVGMGNWQIYFPNATLSGLWRAEDLNYTFQRPHNDFLWILSETGLIGFNLFLFFVISILYLLGRVLFRNTMNKDLKFYSILCLAFIPGYLTISFFDFPKERIEHTIWISIILGIAYYLIKSNSSLRTIYKLNLKRFLILGAFIMMCGITFTGFMRFKGEFYIRKLFNYKNSDQKIQVIEAGKKALSYIYTIDPTSVPINWYTGNAQAALGNYPGAQSDFIQAYKFNPYNRNVLNDLASSYVYSNNAVIAKAYYKEAIRISPRFDDPKLNLAALYINERDFKAADECLKSLMHDSERRTNYQRIVDAEK